MLGLQMCASEPNLESNIFRGEGKYRVSSPRQLHRRSLGSARRGSPLSGAGGPPKPSAWLLLRPGAGAPGTLVGPSPPAAVQASVAQSPPGKRSQRTRRSRVPSSTRRKPLGARASAGKTIALRGGRRVRGLRIQAWSPPLRGPRRQERAGRRSGAVAGGGQTTPPPSCPRASEPAAPPSRLLTLNILVRAECGERAENIPPRGRGEHLSPPPPPPPPLCAGAPAGRRPRLQRPVPPHRTGGHGEGGGLGTTSSVVTGAQSYTPSEKNASHISGKKKGRGGDSPVCVNAASRPIAGRPFKGLPVRPNEESLHLHAAARGQAAAGRECRGAPGLPRPGLREGRSEPPRPGLRGAGRQQHRGTVRRGSAEPAWGAGSPGTVVGAHSFCQPMLPSEHAARSLVPSGNSPSSPALPPRLGAVRPRASAGGRRRPPSAPASVSHLPRAEAPRGRCGATAGAGVLAAQLGGAERFPPRRGAAPGEDTERLRCRRPPGPQGALPQQEWGRVPAGRARGGPVPSGCGRPVTALCAARPGRDRPVLTGHRDS